MNITVNNKNYTVDINAGVAVFTIDKLPVGTYDITATYDGDDNYTNRSVVNVGGLTVVKADVYDMNVTALDVLVGADTTITVHVPVDATGSVVVWVNGTKLVNSTIVSGVATFHISQAVAGRYVVNATLTDVKYANQTVKNTFDLKILVFSHRHSKA